MYAPKSSDELLRGYTELGIPEKEVSDYRERLPSVPHTLYVYLQLAAVLRPDHVFDATYYHASELTYRFAITEFEPTARAWGNFAVLRQEWGRYAEAIRYLELADTLQPTYSNALINLGFCYQQAGEPKKAAEAMRRAIELTGPHVVSLTCLGSSSLLDGDPVEALQYFDKALELDANWDGALFMKAMAEAELKRWTSASQTISAVLRLQPRDEGARALEKSIRRRALPTPIKRPMRPLERWSRRMRDAPLSHWTQNGPWGWVVRSMDWALHPLNQIRRKVFASYRWEAPKHREWVAFVARKIADCGYDVILDQFAPGWLTKERVYKCILQQLADTAVFVPILTNEYRRRVEAVGDLSSDVRTGISLEMGRAFDEWTVALVLASLGRLQLLGLWRNGPTVAEPF